MIKKEEDSKSSYALAWCWLFLPYCWLMYSCDNRKDYFEGLDKQPVVTVSVGSNSWKSDKGYYSLLTDSFKSVYGGYIIDVKLEDDNIDVEFSLSGAGSGDYYTLGGVKYTGPVKTAAGVLQCVFYPGSTGQRTLTIKSEDVYRKAGTAVINLNVINNCPPVSGITWRVVGDVSPYQVEFSAVTSYDCDKNNGGKLVEYEFVVENSYIVNIPGPWFFHIFSGSGTFIVKTRCKDNDNAWSGYSQVLVVL